MRETPKCGADAKKAELSPNYLGVVQPMVTAQKMNYKAANYLV